MCWSFLKERGFRVSGGVASAVACDGLFWFSVGVNKRIVEKGFAILKRK